MLVFFCIAILVLTPIALPLRVGVNFYLNLFENLGFIKVYLFGIRIFKAELSFERGADGNNSLVIHGKKSKEIHLNTDPDDKKSVAAMMKTKAFKNVLIEKLSIHFTAGKTNDAFFTVVLLQSVRVLFYGTLSAIKCRYNVNITESFTPVYNRNALEVDFIGIIGVSIANIIFSFFAEETKKVSKRNTEVIET